MVKQPVSEAGVFTGLRESVSGCPTKDVCYPESSRYAQDKIREGLWWGEATLIFPSRDSHVVRLYRDSSERHFRHPQFNDSGKNALRSRPPPAHGARAELPRAIGGQRWSIMGTIARSRELHMVLVSQYIWVVLPYTANNRVQKNIVVSNKIDYG